MEENQVETVVVEETQSTPVASTPEVKSCNCQPKVEVKTSNPFAIIGFVLSLCSSLLLPALIFSIIGLVKWKDYKASNKGFAIAGIIICGVAVLSGIIAVISLMVIFASAITYLPDFIESLGSMVG